MNTIEWNARGTGVEAVFHDGWKLTAYPDGVWGAFHWRKGELGHSVSGTPEADLESAKRRAEHVYLAITEPLK